MTIDRKDLLERVQAALMRVANVRTGRDVLSGKQVRELDVDESGRVKMQFALLPADPGALVREVRAAVESVPGVAGVKIDIKLPRAPGGGADKPRVHRRELRPGSVPAPTPDPNMLPDVRHVVAVSSGKGGVGKSTVAVNIAAALAASGHAVGLLDADIYGPDIPLMFGERRKPQVSGTRGKEKIVPLDAHGVRLMSLGFLLEDDQPAIMRGPLVSGILRQFIEQVEWGPLDFLIVDMPPGTGDAQLSLVQTIDIEGAVMVTTPQEVSTGDVRRAVRMFERVNTKVLGVVENMSGFECPHCQGHVDVFGRGGGRHLADDMHLPFLGEVPLDPRVRQGGDEGQPTSIKAPDSPAGRAFQEIADRLVAEVERAAAVAR